MTDDVAAIELTGYEAQRADWFEELGFDTVRAIALATARDSNRQLVTVHDVRKVLERGCSIEQAFEIFV